MAPLLAVGGDDVQGCGDEGSDVLSCSRQSAPDIPMGGKGLLTSMQMITGEKNS
jgi:hypothetical protein